MRIRITFSKQGSLRYTGHLDLHTLLERAARRAGLPLAYSQGYHPTPKIQLAAALPLGFSSRAELMDMWLTEARDIPGLRESLQAALPRDIQILDAEIADDRAPALQTLVIAAEYEAVLRDVTPPDLPGRLDEILHASALPRERRGKPYDLRPLIEALEMTPDDGSGRVCLHMRLSAREGATGRPEEVLSALDIPPESARVERTCLIFQP